VGKSLKHMGTGENFLNRTPIAYALRSRTDKWDLIKLQSFTKAKTTVNRTKWQPTDQEKAIQSVLFCRSPITKLERPPSELAGLI
jgi:phage-related protein